MGILALIVIVLLVFIVIGGMMNNVNNTLKSVNGGLDKANAKLKKYNTVLKEEKRAYGYGDEQFVNWFVNTEAAAQYRKRARDVILKPQPDFGNQPTLAGIMSEAMGDWEAIRATFPKAIKNER